MKTAIITIALACALAAAETSSARKFYAGPAPGSSGAVFEYEVKSGETLFQIAERFLGSPYKAEELAKANGIADPLRVKEGTRVKVPLQKGAVRYTVLKLDAEGNYREHDLQTSLEDSERFQIRVTTNVSGYLYAFNRSKDGAVRRIYPAAGRKAWVRAFADYMLPAANYFKLDRARGDEEIWLVLAPQPDRSLEEIADDGGRIEEARMKEMSEAVSEKGIVIAGDGDEAEHGSVVESEKPGRFLLVHPIRIKR